MQKIANLTVKFRPDDPYAPFNEYINDISATFLKFIDEISSLEESSALQKTSARGDTLPLNSLIAYDAACLVHFFNQHTDYYEKNPDDPNVIFVQQILEPINKSVQSRMERK